VAQKLLDRPQVRAPGVGRVGAKVAPACGGLTRRVIPLADALRFTIEWIDRTVSRRPGD